MIKKIAVSGFIISISFVLISAVHRPFSGGAPSASSGAPDEQSCAMSTCHDDNTINTGTAALNVEIPSNAAEGEIVPIKISMSDAGKVRFGFQVTALDEMNKKIGSFIISDSTRTQIIGDNINFPDREYLTYTYLGTYGGKSGNIEWTASWKSPLKKGKVTYYVAALSADNDGGDKGDFVYTTSKSLTVVSSLNTPKVKPLADVSLSISSGGLLITNPHYSFIDNLSIVNMEGKALLNKSIKNAGSHILIDSPEFPKGVLFITLYNSHGSVTKKIFVSND